MDTIKAEFVDAIVAILTDLVPGGKYARKPAMTAARSLLSRGERNAITRAADRIFDELYSSVGADVGNPGAAKSAAYNVLDAVKKAELSPKVIVDCSLDPELLYEHMMKFPAEGIDQASAIRRRLYHQGLMAFCVELVTNALSIPSVELLVYQRILRNQSLILQRLDQREPPDGSQQDP